MSTKFNDLLGDIIHLASGAIISDDENIKRQAMGDILNGIISVVPWDGSQISSASADVKSSENKRLLKIETPREPEAGELTGFQKFLAVAPGVTLVRFHGRDEIKLVARRKGTSGNPNTIFEIMVDKAAKVASVWRDSKILFEINGCGTRYSEVEAIAVSGLKRWFKDQRKRNARNRRKRKARLGILTPEQELARTVAEQKEGL